MDELRRYRVLPGPEPDTLRFLDRETYEPAVVSVADAHVADADDDAVAADADDDAVAADADAVDAAETDATDTGAVDAANAADAEDTADIADTDEAGAAAVADLYPGYLVDAELDWSTAEPTARRASVVRPTLYAFADRADPMFEAARETWEAARADGDGMNVRVTRNTDNEPNGVVYVFAESGDRGRFEEFREGARPIEPLVDRLNDRQGTAPREVFVLRPPAGNYTVVAIALRKGGQLADTMRDTYDCERPEELRA